MIKCYIDDMVNRSIPLGLTENEVSKMFGFDRKVYTNGIWSYEVPMIFSKTKRMLNLYFYEGKVIEIKHKKKDFNVLLFL